MAVSVEDWVAWVFDHSVKRPRMALEFRNKRWDHPTASTLQVITKLFESPALPLKQFSDAQLNQGFWFLCRNGGAMQGLVDERIPWEMRLRCIRSFVALFRNLFAVRCTRSLSHLERPGQVPTGVSPLNSACYMWWDFDCWAPKPNDGPHRRIDGAFLGVMEEILTIRHEACCESALHGLGHWHSSYPVEAEQIISAFMSPPRRISDELRGYADNARRGCVL